MVKINKYKVFTLVLLSLLIVVFFLPTGKSDLSLASQFIRLIIQSGQTQNPLEIQNSTGSTILKISSDANITINDVNENPSVVIGRGSGTETAGYIIFTDGTTVYAKNGTTGAIQFSGQTANLIIQSVINNLPEKGEIYLSPGVYNITARIFLNRSNLIFRGAGPNTTILRMANSSNQQSVLRILGDNIQIRDLQIDGNKANQQSGTGHGISWSSGKYFVIDNLWVVETRSNGISLVTTSLQDLHGVVTNNRVLNTGSLGHSISLDGGGAMIISNNEIINTSSGTIAIRIVNSVKTTVSHNIIKHNRALDAAGFGIFVATGSQDVTVVGNVVENAEDDGIVANNVTDVTIVGNIVLTSGGPGIAATNSAKRIIISSNTLRNTTHGILVTVNAQDVSVIGNSVFNSSNDGIRLDAVSPDLVTRVLISGNILINSTGYGILVQGNSSNYTIIGNVFLQNGLGDLSLVGSRVVKFNTGFVTETENSTSVVNGTDLPHGLSGTPSYVTCTPTRINVTCSVTSVNSTHITLGMFFINGSAVASAQTVYWEAVFKP